MVDWVSFSYSTEVLRGTMPCFRAPEAHASLGFMLELLASPALVSKEDAAAWWNALTMFTDVSRTLHCSGRAWEAVVREGSSWACSRCLRRAKRTSAGSSASSFWGRGALVGLGGEREPAVGALIYYQDAR